ncbi:unnamed protein product, partial [Ectocarpus sp. 8 AP-2014]
MPYTVAQERTITHPPHAILYVHPFACTPNDARGPGNPARRQVPPDQQRIKVERERRLGKVKPLMKSIGETNVREYRHTVTPGGKSSILLVALTMICALPGGILANPQGNWAKNSRSLDGADPPKNLTYWSKDMLKIQRVSGVLQQGPFRAWCTPEVAYAC